MIPRQDHTCIVDAAVAYTESDRGKAIILSISQVIKMNSLDCHLLCSIQSCMNGVLIDEVSKFLAPILSETMHATQLENIFDATHPIIIPLKLYRVTNFFEVRKLIREEYEEQNILKIELMVEAPPWDLSSP